MGACANNQVAFLASDGLKCTNLKEILKTVFPCTNGQILQHTSSGYLRCASNSATAPLGTGILGDTTVLYHPNAIDPDRYTICRSNQVVTITDQGVECVNLGTVLHALLSASSCTDGQILRFNGDDRLRCTDYRSGVPGNLTSLGSAIPVTSETTCATHQVATITVDGLVCTNLGLLLENTFPSCSYKVMEYDSGGNIVCVDHLLRTGILHEMHKSIFEQWCGELCVGFKSRRGRQMDQLEFLFRFLLRSGRHPDPFLCRTRLQQYRLLR